MSQILSDCGIYCKMLGIQKHNPNMGIIKVDDWEQMLEDYKQCYAVHVNSHLTERITGNDDKTKIMVLIWRSGKVVDYCFVSVKQYKDNDLGRFTVERLYGDDVITVNGLQMTLYVFLTGMPRRACYIKFGRNYDTLP